MDYAAIQMMSPGFLIQLNQTLLLARNAGERMERHSSTDTIGYVFTGEWYSRQFDSVTTQFSDRWKLTPDPFHNGGSPSRLDRSFSLTLSDSTHTSSNLFAVIYHSLLIDNHYQGHVAGQTVVTLRISGTTQTNWVDFPIDYSQLDNRKSSNRYRSPEFTASGAGSINLGLNEETLTIQTYSYSGNWTVPANPSVGATIGTLSVGGEPFAIYTYTGFDDSTGLYRGEYRFVGRSEPAINFVMTNSTVLK